MDLPYTYTTGEISVTNLTGDVMSVQVTQLQGGPDSSFNESLSLEPLEISEQDSIPVRRQLLIFSAPGMSVDLNCTLKFEHGEYIQFVAVPEGIMISSDVHSAAVAGELDLNISSVCRQ